TLDRVTASGDTTCDAQQRHRNRNETGLGAERTCDRAHEIRRRYACAVGDEVHAFDAALRRIDGRVERIEQILDAEERASIVDCTERQPTPLSHGIDKTS